MDIVNAQGARLRPVFEIGDRLAKARTLAGISATAMAVQLGVARQTISNWEHGHTRVPRATVLLYAQFCGVHLDWLEHGD